jgi:two-component system, OmpR family, phosphate regulon response regulator PhoB
MLRRSSIRKMARRQRYSINLKEGEALPASSIRILIIEDERDVRIYLANLLGANGYKALTAENVKEGLALAHSENPALIVLDAMLPGDDAQRVYTELRCQSGLCRIPVVVLSTITRRALRGSRLYGRESAGRRIPPPDAYLNKPPEAEDFLAVVRRLTPTAEPVAEEEGP